MGLELLDPLVGRLRPQHGVDDALQLVDVLEPCGRLCESRVGEQVLPFDGPAEPLVGRRSVSA